MEQNGLITKKITKTSIIKIEEISKRKTFLRGLISIYVISSFCLNKNLKLDKSKRFDALNYD
ncbi:hypothetical protein BpHYR1_032103 [Brachionus plicatilis]|uniref:Uncharacterized protein n=1 Tax=Brachionus plicatilis TaxID=10195 RepID=A0A3M7RC84_BRAPC|nr:hypothetical protein BpHYR1_032103 [Brachionus plicatilis]